MNIILHKMEGKYTISYNKVDLDESNVDFRTIPELLQYHATVTPNKPAFVFLSTNAGREIVTWKDTFEKSQRFAKSLTKLGIQPKEVVAISYRTCPEWLFTNFGAIMAGARPISLSFTYEDGSDVIAMMERLETCSAIFLDPGLNDATWNIFKQLVDDFNKKGHVKSSQMPSLRYLAALFKPEGITEILTFNELLYQSNEDTPLPKLDVDEIVALFQTSGSTGVPKIIAHTHRFFNYVGFLFQYLGFGPDEIVYNDRPFSWAGGCPDNLYHGETRVTRSGMCKTPENTTDWLFKAIVEERCTCTLLFPAMIEELLQREIPYDWPLKTLFTGGQPISKHSAKCLDKGLCKWFGVAYGSSETTLCLCNLVNTSDVFVEHSCGKPVPGIELKIVDNNGEVVPVYSRGELLVRTKAMFSGYYNDPEKTKEVLLEDGWCKTDDIAFMTDDGIFYIEGRKSDMIISGGMNVAPSILEAILKTFRGVKDAIVVPIAHKTLYQVICACVIPQTESDVSEASLRKQCEEIHADKSHLFTVLPTYYLIFESFPETFTGKPSRKLLAAEAALRLQEVQ